MSYILKVQPMLDESRAKKIERNLSKRFQNVAKKFGRGLQTAFKFGLTGGAVGATFAMLSNAVLNPLREAEERLNAVLAKAGDINTRAEQFSTTRANYIRLLSAANAKGVDESSVINMLSRFQSMIGEAAQGKDNILYKYKDETDIVVAFTKAIDAIQKIEDRNIRSATIAQVLGQKAVGKTASFLSSDINQLMTDTSGVYSSDDLNAATISLSRIEDEQSLLKVIEELRDYVDKSKNIVSEDVIAQIKRARTQNEKSTEYIKMYSDLATIVDKLDQINLQMAKAAADLVDNDKRTAAIDAGVDAAVDVARNTVDVVKTLKAINTKLQSLSTQTVEKFNNAIGWGTPK